MSYARWVKGVSDVYVFATALQREDGYVGLECASCLLEPGSDSYLTHSYENMIAHLQEHRKHGHLVEDNTFEFLRSDMAKDILIGYNGSG